MQTLYMGMTIPYPGGSSTYVDDYNDSFEIIDSHDHVTVGNRLNQDSVTWSDIDLNSNAIVNANYIKMGSVVSTSDFSLYVTGGELYYIDGSSNVIQLTSNGQINYTSSYSGFYGNLELYGAYCNYTSDDNTYTFGSDGDTVIVCNNMICDSATVETLSVTGSFSNDSQTDMVQSSEFPGDYDETTETTFLLDSDGILRTAYLTEEATPYSILKYDATTAAINKVSYIYSQNTELTTISPVVSITSTASFSSDVRVGTLLASSEDKSNMDALIRINEVVGNFPNFSQTTSRYKQRPQVVHYYITPEAGGSGSSSSYYYCINECLASIQIDFNSTNSGYYPLIIACDSNITLYKDTDTLKTYSIDKIAVKIRKEGLVSSTTGNLKSTYFLDFSFYPEDEDYTLEASNFVVGLYVWFIWMQGDVVS